MDPRRQSWLVLCQARSEAHKVWIVRRLRGIPLAASEYKVVRPHGKECRERVKVASMCHDEGQEKLRAAEVRLAPAASAARA